VSDPLVAQDVEQDVTGASDHGKLTSSPRASRGRLILEPFGVGGN
jgi:hypothetical protein